MKNWCFWTVILEKTLGPLDCKGIQPVHPRGNQSWVFIGRNDVEAETPILWPIPYVKNRLIRKDPDAGKDWRQEKGTTEDEMVGWHHQLDGHEFEQDIGLGDGTGKAGALQLQRVGHNWVTELNWTLVKTLLWNWRLQGLGSRSWCPWVASVCCDLLSGSIYMVQGLPCWLRW